jgi:hypothetical protein
MSGIRYGKWRSLRSISIRASRGIPTATAELRVFKKVCGKKLFRYLFPLEFMLSKLRKSAPALLPRDRYPSEIRYKDYDRHYDRDRDRDRYAKAESTLFGVAGQGQMMRTHDDEQGKPHPRPRIFMQGSASAFGKHAISGQKARSRGSN